MKLGLGNQLVVNPVNSVPLGERPTLGVSFDRSRYTNPLGFANQAAVGSSDFKLQSYAGPSLTFTRSSAATFRGSNGLIQYAPENLLSYSEDFSTSWGKPAIGVSSNVAVSPAGTSTADLIYPSSSGSAREIFVAFTYTSGLTYTASLYAKYAGKQWITLGTNNGTVANRCAWFDILNGIKGQVATGYQSEIESIGNGWYRLKVVISGSTSPYFDIGIVDADGSGVVTKNGTDGAYVWGAQLERASAASPYISTTSQPRYGPRFEYDTNGEPLGLLMEEQSQNLLSYSEQFNDGAWFKNNLNTTGTPAWLNVAAAPNGTQTADLIIANGVTTQHAIYTSVQASIGITYTWSVYAKANSLTQIKMTFGPGGNTNGAFFNLNNGTKGTVNSGYSSKITALSDGWYRCSIAYTSAITGTSYPIVYLANGSESLTVTNGSIYIWGAQLEAKPFATSYIPTVGGSLTRNADVVSVPIGTWYNTDTGTIVVEGSRFNTAATTGAGFDSLFDFYNSTAVSPVLRHAAIDYEQFEAFTTGFVSIGSVYVDTEVAPNLPIKFGLTYDSTISAFAASVNNSAVVSASGIDPLETPQTLRLGLSTDNSYWNGYIKSFSYTTKYRPDNIQALTA